MPVSYTFITSLKTFESHLIHVYTNFTLRVGFFEIWLTLTQDYKLSEGPIFCIKEFLMLVFCEVRRLADTKTEG